MAFQIVDDVLDLTASEEVLGKPVASDLREGKATMAVHARAGALHPGGARHDRNRAEQRRASTASPTADIVAILQRHGSIDAAYARAVGFANQAREAICTFPDSEIKRVLLWVPEFVVERES